MTDHTLVVQESISLGAIQAGGPQEVINSAAAIANELKKIITSQNLYSTISGRNFVKVEGWTTMGAMLGIVPREVSVVEHESGDFEATVELVRAGDGAVIGRASAIVGSDEKSWASRPRYARRSMAVTRATGKAFRLGFSWIVTLAGFEPTPAEEMDMIEGQIVEPPATVKAADKAPEPKQENALERPYPPQTVRDAIQAKAQKHKDFTPTPAQENLLRYGLELCFAGQPSRDQGVPSPPREPGAGMGDEEE